MTGQPLGQQPHNLRIDGLRHDFAETVYWHPALVLPQDGKATVSFSLSDSVTSFQVTAFAHTLDGRLGAATKAIESRVPLTLAPKVPLEVTSTDRTDLPFVVTNNTGDKRGIQMALTKLVGLELLGGDRDRTFDLAGEGQTRKLFRFRPALVRGTAGQRLRPGGRIVGQRPQARERVAVEADHDRLRGRRPRPTQPEQPLQAALLLEAEPDLRRGQQHAGGGDQGRNRNYAQASAQRHPRSALFSASRSLAQNGARRAS